MEQRCLYVQGGWVGGGGSDWGGGGADGIWGNS